MANPLDYNVNAFTKGVNGFGRKPPTVIYSITLAGATVKTLTVPSTAAIGAINSAQTNTFLAIFSYEPVTEFWVAVNATAAVPAGANFTSSTSELLPSAYIVRAADVIQVISTAGGDMSISFYAIPDA